MKSCVRRALISILISTASISSLNAGNAFDVLHAHYREALQSGHIIRAINLYKPISERTDELRHDLLRYRAEHNEKMILETEKTLRSYNKYLVTEEEAKRMGILREQTKHPELLREASIFLYENTDFFRPTITIKDELAIGSQVHVWIAKPGTEITFEHDYDSSKLDGRIFTGYRRTDGSFKKGEFPTFPMSYDSEVWYAEYDYGCVFSFPYLGYEIFSPMDEDGRVEIPTVVDKIEGFRLSGWIDKETKELIATKDSKHIDIEGNSRILQPIWENVRLDQLHLGNSRKNMKHGSHENYYLDITNLSTTDMVLLVEADSSSKEAITERVFEFVEIKEGESKRLGPYDIEALLGNGRENVPFSIHIKSMNSENEWFFNPSLSIR